MKASHRLGGIIMEQRTPLLTCLQEHDKLHRSSFHTPGHKCSSFLPLELLRLDYTELPDTDALYEAAGAIRKTEEALSHLFHSGRSLISAGGCTLAIQTMLKIASDRGKTILFARNAHRSAVSAAALLGIDPVWLLPTGDNGFTGTIRPEEVEEAFRNYPDASALYITSPSYYGEISDIPVLSDICHQHGALLIVDNAHGSHLAFMKENLHPLHLGADMTACSLHKTLPVLTGGAALQIRSQAHAEGAKEAMALFGSTSPSYPIMCSIDLCVDYLLHQDGISAYQACEKRVESIRQTAVQCGLQLPSGLCDPLRITLNTASVGLTGKQQIAYFESCGIDCEFCDGENAVMICTPFNTEEDFLRLETAVRQMPRKEALLPRKRSFFLPQQRLSLRQAVLSPSVCLPVEQAEGHIAADTACPCPPGVPLIMPGEIISKSVQKELLQAGIRSIRIVRDKAGSTSPDPN